MSDEGIIKYLEEWLNDEYSLNTEDKVCLKRAIKAIEENKELKQELSVYKALCGGMK